MPKLVLDHLIPCMQEQLDLQQSLMQYVAIQFFFCVLACIRLAIILYKSLQD